MGDAGVHIDPRDLFYYAADETIFEARDAHEAPKAATPNERMSWAVAKAIERLINNDTDAFERACQALKESKRSHSELETADYAPEPLEVQAVLQAFFLARHDPPELGDPKRRCRVHPYGPQRCLECETCQEQLR